MCAGIKLEQPCLNFKQGKSMKLMNWEENAITFPFWKKMDALSLKLNGLRFNDSLMIYPMQGKK